MTAAYCVPLGSLTVTVLRVAREERCSHNVHYLSFIYIAFAIMVSHWRTQPLWQRTTANWTQLGGAGETPWIYYHSKLHPAEASLYTEVRMMLPRSKACWRCLSIIITTQVVHAFPARVMWKKLCKNCNDHTYSIPLAYVTFIFSFKKCFRMTRSVRW